MARKQYSLITLAVFSGFFVQSYHGRSERDALKGLVECNFRINNVHNSGLIRPIENQIGKDVELRLRAAGLDPLSIFGSEEIWIDITVLEPDADSRQAEGCAAFVSVRFRDLVVLERNKFNLSATMWSRSDSFMGPCDSSMGQQVRYIVNEQIGGFVTDYERANRKGK